MIKSEVISVVLICLFVSIASVSAYSSISNLGHGGNDIYIKVKNADMSLQQAIDSSALNGTISGGGTYSGTLSFGHLGSEVWLKVNGTEKSLQQAINDGNLCCSSCNGVFSGYSQSGSGSWHYASNLTITNKTGTEKSLQQAIEDKDFCNPVAVIVPPKTCYSALVYGGLYVALADEGRMGEDAGASLCASKYPAGTWHLPSVSELNTLFVYSSNVPSFCTQRLPAGTCPYWSSTFAWNNGYIWNYVLSAANQNPYPISTIDTSFFIRCVRYDMFCQ